MTAPSPLRVLYLTSSLAGGGAERQMVNLLTHLDHDRVRPELAVYHFHDHFMDRVRSAAIPVHDLGRGLHGGKDPRVLWRLSRLLRRSTFDLVHSTLSAPGQLARLAALGLRLPVITSERDLFMGDSRPRFWLEKRLARRGSAMIANSQRTADHVARRVPAWRGRVNVIHNGIECGGMSAATLASARALREQYLQKDEHLLLVLARLDQNKGPDLLARALRELSPEQQARARLLWVGANIDQVMLGELLGLNNEPGLAGRVHWLPPTTQPEVYLAAADTLILPSRRESMPNAVLEAMAAAKPVIATDTGDVARAVRPGQTGWLIPPRDSAALAAAIGEALAAPLARLSDMGQAGRALVCRDFSIQRMLDDTLRVYRQVLAQA